MSAYAYIEQAYGVSFKVGQRVAFVEEGCARREGVVRRPMSGAEHYVAVEFDGTKHKVPCHPRSVEAISTSAPDPHVDHHEAQARYRVRANYAAGNGRKAVYVKEPGRDAAEALLALMNVRDGPDQWLLERQPYPRGYWRVIEASRLQKAHADE